MSCKFFFFQQINLFNLPVVFHLQLVGAQALVLLEFPPNISSVFPAVDGWRPTPFFVGLPPRFALLRLFAAASGGTRAHVCKKNVIM